MTHTRKLIEALETRTLLTTVTVDPLTVTEDQTSAVFVATLDAPSTQDVVVAYRTMSRTARAGADYQPAQGTFTIAAGDTSAQVTVALIDDNVYEPDETFAVALRTATPGVQVSGKLVAATITDDETAPTVSMSDVQVAEGNKGFTNTTAAVSLSNPASRPVRLFYSSIEGTANAGSDYKPVRGVLTFRPGITDANINLRILGDTTAEADETFTVQFQTANANAHVAAAAVASNTFSTVTIIDDDGGTSVVVPLISIASVEKDEGDDGTSTADLIVSLTSPTSKAVTVAYATADSTAKAGVDYVAANGTLTFAPGETSKTITVTINGDTDVEVNDTFTVTLTNPSNATIATSTATVTINNDDSATASPTPTSTATPTPTATPTVSVGTASMTEGDAGTTTLNVPVTLSAASSSPVTVAYATTDGTATAGSDFTAASGTLTFAAGETSKAIAITVAGDTTVESDETFTVTLKNPTNATLATASAAATIVNDDANTSTGGGSTGSTSTTDLSDNLSATSGGTESVTGSTKLAASFKTGTAAVTLKSIALLLAQGTAGATAAVVQVYTDAGLQPGTLIGSLTSPSSFSSSLAQTVFTTTGLSLAANTTYWVVLSVNSGTLNWSWTEDTAGAGFTGEWGSSEDGGTTWFTDDAFPLQMSVNVA